jgi:hypothetical protein
MLCGNASTKIIFVCPKVPFVKETLKDHLRETLKELKMSNFNERGSNEATLQYDDVWND